MKKLYVLGTGQLGRMLRQAGEPLGIAIYLLSADSKIEITIENRSLITAEIEHWPDTQFTKKLAVNDSFINRDVFPIVSDRLFQKQFLDRLNLVTVPWKPLLSSSQWDEIFSLLGTLVVVKQRTGGYDGKSQWRLCSHSLSLLPNKFYDNAIVEKTINFIDEISLIGARGYNGKIIFYPLTYNFHQDGILRASVVLRDVNSLQKELEDMLACIMNQLNYIGIMTMECFVTKKGIFINELAPRVHNSGHWTQNGASINQFEMHLRAILDFPMPPPIIYMPAVMLNLIGININIDWLNDPIIHLHWYNKEVYSHRKVGHLNVVSDDPMKISIALSRLESILPPTYAKSISWLQKKLSRDKN
ncbi:5-(carboxyamino)imidazole ribonucleotide synthase [Candidatus Erwinia haradaeae]|uniref:N5-carboxyaminoimidazole ribonucleotide synthase n=1 Tax=Candidatus Erwinia haradaeae TaxID=1922217 RepID=A0A803FTM7_9GAMM|nr:5-(carboxyamino)imidazole ribonucleotide synthase [Candidatus Erwinia haradaeae]VFP88076.1 N5-carboxyaminoimidazole ribonucleotide synthase [Candidatus Erwinia haradaeae]